MKVACCSRKVTLSQPFLPTGTFPEKAVLDFHFFGFLDSLFKLQENIIWHLNREMVQMALFGNFFVPYPPSSKYYIVPRRLVNTR